MKKIYKRFLSRIEFPLFGYRIRITKDRPEWKMKKAKKKEEVNAIQVELLSR